MRYAIHEVLSPTVARKFKLRGKEPDASTVSLAMLPILRNNDKISSYSHLTLHLTVYRPRRPYHGAAILTNR